jgi:predicted nucleotide-binding protein (sugar kinase/HSP70/actin superfamily)
MLCHTCNRSTWVWSQRGEGAKNKTTTISSEGLTCNSAKFSHYTVKQLLHLQLDLVFFPSQLMEYQDSRDFEPSLLAH